MALQFILGSSRSGKTDFIYEQMIKDSMEHEDEEFFFLVPDQSTLNAQRQLVQRHPRHGTFNIDVVGFFRLTYRIFEELSYIPKDLLESELFGYEGGAFTGAKKGGKIGKFELADGGTLLLDEIGEMPLPLQSKLLRVLQEKEIERVGGITPIKVDVRLICSTNQNLTQLIQEGRFRADLYYRINTIELAIPPLRDRLDDIPELCNFFIQKFNRENGSYTQGIDQEVLALMQQYTWPGNVRELEHVIERLCFLNGHSTIHLSSCDFLIHKMSGENTLSKPAFSAASSLQEQRCNAEIDLIRQTLRQTDGNKAKAARLLGIDRTVLYRKLKKYHIDQTP